MVRGSCLCGEVRFVVNGPISALSNCHCSECRKAYGSAFGTIAVCRAEDFEYLSGESLISAYRQTENVIRRFCNNCGSQLPIKEDADPLVGVPAGLLDDDPEIRPTEHIFVGSKAPWWTISDAVPQFEEGSPLSASYKLALD